MKNPKTNVRRVRNRLKVDASALVTPGMQCRAVRELRGLSKQETARRMEMDQDSVTRLEKKFWGGRGFSTLNKYLEAIGATLVIIPMPHPSFVNHETIHMEQPVPSATVVEHNLAPDSEEYPDHN